MLIAGDYVSHRGQFAQTSEFFLNLNYSLQSYPRYFHHFGIILFKSHSMIIYYVFQQ